MTTKRKHRRNRARELEARIAHLERIVICKHCNGEGTTPHKIMGRITCWPCEGTGNRIDAMEAQE